MDGSRPTLTQLSNSIVPTPLVGTARLLSTLRRGLLIIPLVFLAIFFFYPLFSILIVSLFPEGQLDLSGFTRLISSSYYVQTLWFTTWQALLSTVLTIGLALPGAYVFTRYRFPGKTLLMSLATLPFVLPTVVVAAAFNALIGENGLLNAWLMNLFQWTTPPIQLERTISIILIVHVFYNYAVALRLISGFWANQSPRIEEAARVLGANRWQLWWYVRLPMLRPAILAASVLVFIFTFTSFGVIVILGGLKFATLEVEIYRQARSLFNLPMAAALSLVQIGLMFGMMLVYTRLQRQSSVDLQASYQIARLPHNVRQWLLVSGNLSLMVILLFTPLLALIIRAFTVGGGVTNFTRLGETSRGSVLFVAPAEAITNSLNFAGLTTILALVLGVLTSYLLAGRGKFTRWLDAVFMLPLATSAVTLGFGFLIAFNRQPLKLGSTAWIVVLAHTLVALPFVVRSVLPALKSIPPSLPEAARVLGASPFKVWRYIELPLIARGIIVGATFAFTVSMGEFGASLFAARPDTPTMPIVIFRLLGQPGVTNYGQALAMSVILMAVCGISFIVIERVRVAGIGEF